MDCVFGFDLGLLDFELNFEFGVPEFGFWFMFLLWN